MKAAPPSGWLVAVSVPPCSVITRWASANPIPWPCDFVVKKGMKIFCRSDAAMRDRYRELRLMPVYPLVGFDCSLNVYSAISLIVGYCFGSIAEEIK